MMNQNYLSFLRFDGVVRVETEADFIQLVELCRARGLSSIQTLDNIGFEKLHFSGSRRRIQEGNLCVEFRISDGAFTIDDWKSYADYGCEIFSVDDLM